ncbi:uncharacterized protein LOC127260177 isoform X2 [Andrographis paniculata]|uniref:uncharacterized protein LOC127260177 isoform X2 n=1 Tax=Andrographis paniculata TaxID=175694 RepID=UPI0021E8D41B|nr:uncharacterized protein LOC127260177 isoform X2 [Andrographis paniculata]
MMAELKSVSMKLLIDRESKRVLFAEAGKECVDFLVYLLSLPVANMVALLNDNNLGMVGSLGILYDSINNLNDTYLQNGAHTKKSILRPPLPGGGGTCPMLLQSAAAPARGRYTDTSSDMHYFDSDGGYSCEERGGFVKGVMTYTVMDNLEIKPMSSISCITSITGLKIKDMSLLEEMIVYLGIKEGLSLLKASFKSKQVLTDVFVQGGK